jgi:hypothetical protein
MLLLIGIAVLVLGFFGVIFWASLGIIGSTEKKQKAAESRSSEILDAAFDGREDVTFQINWTTLKYETVVLGAKERGYALSNQAGDPKGAMTLVFEKATSGSEPRAELG